MRVKRMKIKGFELENESLDLHVKRIRFERKHRVAARQKLHNHLTCYNRLVNMK